MAHVFDHFINVRRYLFRFALAVTLAAAAYSAMDFFALKGWDADESLVVKVLEVGNERPALLENQEDNMFFQTTETELVIRILTGPQTGLNFPLTVTQMKEHGLDLKRGRKYILIADFFEDGAIQYSITDIFRIPAVIGVLSFACAFLIAFAGRAGFMALVGLGLSVACLLWVLVPLAAKGFPPVPLAFLAVIFISAVTVVCVVRRKKQRKAALFGALGGMAGAWLIGFVVVELWQLSGLAGEGAPLLATTVANIDIKGVLLASIMISAIGAVLDVGISITAAMSELIEYDPEIDLFRLWTAGIRVGSEVLGSMINTLILAYIGTSLPMVMLISNADTEFWGLMNDPYVGQELVQSLAGTSGLLLTIPMTAAFFVLQEKLSRR